MMFLRAAVCLTLFSLSACAGSTAKDSDNKAPEPKVSELSLALSTAAKDPATVTAGAEVFRRACESCHGTKGDGEIGPDLTDSEWDHGGQPEQIYKVIDGGLQDQGMPAFGRALGPEKVKQVTAFVLTLSAPKAP